MQTKSPANKYANLISNTLLFAVGGFGSKLLGFILIPIVTRQLDTTSSGIATNILVTCNLILPVMYLCISEAVIRFGVDNKGQRNSVYTSGILVVLMGFTTLMVLFPLVNKIPVIYGQTLFVYLFVLASSLRTVTSHYVRSQGYVRLFAFDGILTTVLYFLSIILFLIVLDMGVEGFLLATLVPDLLSFLFMSFIAKTWRNFTPFRFDKSVMKKMLVYSVPLVPAAVSWWITNASDKYLITYFLTESDNGIYSYSDRIPQIILIISTIFIQAWQMSAFAETDENEVKRFYSNVFKSYSSLVFLVAGGLILLIKPLTRILLSAEYFEAWKYSLFLILSVVYSTMVTFLGTIYNHKKKNTMVTVTTVLSGVLDIVLNYFMIPVWGVLGATISTFICYFAVFLIRAIDSRRYMKLDIQPFRIAASTLLLLGQIVLSLKEIKFGSLIQIGLILLIFVFNAKNLLFVLRMAMRALYKRNSQKAEKA